MQIVQYHTSLVMKNPFRLLLALTLLLSSQSFGQDIRQQSCQNGGISRQADSLRKVYTDQGYELVREASMTMESE